MFVITDGNKLNTINHKFVTSQQFSCCYSFLLIYMSSNWLIKNVIAFPIKRKPRGSGAHFPRSDSDKDSHQHRKMVCRGRITLINKMVKWVPNYVNSTITQKVQVSGAHSPRCHADRDSAKAYSSSKSTPPRVKELKYLHWPITYEKWIITIEQGNRENVRHCRMGNSL